MSPEERKGATGTMMLFYEWEESPSSLWDSSRKIELIGNDDYVILQVHNHHFNQLKRADAIDRTERYKFKTQDLIDYIKANGELLK